MRTFTFVALLAATFAGHAHAQAASIDPGMTKEQVIAKLGKPTSEHSSSTATYLYYANGQEKKVGMSDMVALENGKVVDAVFRSPSRKYTGKSSSPAAISEEAAAARGNGGKAPPMKMPAASKAPEKKIAPPTTRKTEPLIKPGAKKIQAPPKSADTAKKAAPAPAKKP
jgi:hypothetical protein